MAVWDIKTLWGFMLVLTGAAGVGVDYPDHVCAVKGSTVTLLCTFTPVESVTVNQRTIPIHIKRVRWCQNHRICQGNHSSVYDSQSERNDSRYKYLGDKTRNCTLQITEIQKKDEATFRFRMEANDVRGHFTDQSGVNVTVTDDTPMRITSSSGDSPMRGGENVTLYCTAACTFHQLEVTWLKDNLKLPESGTALQLSPLTAKDSGNYTCSLKTSAHHSQPFSLHVEEDEVGGSFSGLAVGVVFGVLLALFTLTLVLFIIRRKRAAVAGRDQSLVGGDLGQKHPQNICSHVLPLEEEGGTHRQETSQAVDDVSYAAIQFSRANQTGEAMEAQDAIIYTSVANRR
uniref:uncharacterized protein LOC124064272 n=1 Tax=Scatophagus argus TaxID=75038 RepID=UPI001ED824C5|nr:uncharacterized protein LOC124064272 [Scatophagus argus]